MKEPISFKDYPLLEDKAKRLINMHSKNGFVVISACRANKTRQENLQRIENLKKDLKEMGWSYTVAYGGGFKEKGEGEFDTSKAKFNEISFVVYNYNKNKRNLLKDMLSLCGKYEQDDIYYQEPDGKAYWYNSKGEKDATFSSMTKNDDGQQYFTGFGSSKLSKNLKKKYLKTGEVNNKKALEHRFSGIMEAINPPPVTRAEAIIRANNGEVFVSSYNVLTEEEAYKLLNMYSYFPY